MKVSILSEGGRGFGYGHLTRCLALYQAFTEKDIQPSFFVNGDDSVADVLAGVDYRQICWVDEGEKVLREIRDSDVVIVDSYLAEASFYQKIADSVKTVLSFDDDRRISYPSGFVLNAAPGADNLGYPNQPEVHYLLGPQYIPLRKAFWEVEPKTISSSVSEILFLLGGSGHKDVALNFLKFFEKQMPGCKVHLVVTRAMDNVPDLQRNLGPDIVCAENPDAAGMKTLMMSADLAISAGGQTLYELACTGVPTIGICVADNQQANLDGLEQEGVLKNVGQVDDPLICSRLGSQLEALTSEEQRTEMSRRGRSLIDGQGARRVVDMILNRS